MMLLTVAATLTASAQIKGTVTLEGKEPAPYATVMLFADSVTDGSPKAYAITDSKGGFTIKSTPTKGNYLVVRYLGYKEYREPIAASTHKVAIQLQADALKLNAVKVEAKYKSVEVSGDTIKFNTEYFKTGTEDNAAEVLNKIPGMEVGDNGEVSYAGKKVDKVTIDGKDMFSSGSDGALNTLSADAVMGAEIVQNARSNSIIDDFTGRELTTLNVKTDGRTRLNGKVSTMGGIKDKWKSENSALLIGKKLSFTAIASANNTGEAVFSFSDYFQHIVGLDNLLSSNGRGFALNEDELMMLIPPSNVYRSQSGVTTLSGNWQPSDKLKVKGSFIANGSLMDGQSLSEQEYISLGMTHHHLLESGKRNRFFSGQLQETWKPRKHIEVSNRTRVAHTGMFTNDSLDESGINDLLAVEDNQMRKLSIDEEMVTNIEMGDNLLSAHFGINHEQRNYSYGLTTDQMLLPAIYYMPFDNLYQMDNRRTYTTTEITPDLTYALKLGKRFTLNTTLALDHHSTLFNYHPLDSADVDADLTSDKLNAHVELNKNKGLFRFSLGNNFNWRHYKSSIDDLDGSKTFSMLPHASLMLSFSSTHRLSLSASLSESDIELERLIRDPLVTGYKSLYAGSYVTSPISNGKNINLNYYLYDLFSNTLFFANAGITANNFTLRPYTLQDSTIATSTIYRNDGEYATRYLTANMSKGLGSWPIDAKLSGSLSQSESSTTVNGTNGTLSSISKSASLAFVSRSKKAFNGEIGATYTRSESQYLNLSDNTSSMVQYGGHAAASVTFKKLRVEVRFTYTHLDNGAGSSENYDLGFRAEYRMARWRLQLRGSNLTNLNRMSWMSVDTTPYYISRTTFRRMPGYLIAGVAYRF